MLCCMSSAHHASNSRVILAFVALALCDLNLTLCDCVTVTGLPILDCEVCEEPCNDEYTFPDLYGKKLAGGIQHCVTLMVKYRGR